MLVLCSGMLTWSGAMNRLRMGVIGVGGIAQMMHLPHMADDERYEIVALADINAPALEAVGARYGITTLYTSAAELLARPDIQAVGVFHGGSHAGTVLAALAAGKDVFVEKPLAWNVREAETIAAAVRATDRIVQVGYHKLYDPAFAITRQELVRIPDLAYGRITVLHPDDSLGWSTHRVLRGNGVVVEGHREPVAQLTQLARGAREGLAEGSVAALVDEALGARKADSRLRLAYGLMTASLIHQVYMLFGLLGAPERVLHTDVWREGLSMQTLIAYPDDVRVALDWQYLSHLKDYREEYAFFGNHERVALDFPSPYLRNFPSPITIQGHDGELTWEKRITVSYDEAFRRELAAFYEHVQARQQPEHGSVEDAVAHHRLIQAMIDAAE